VSTIRCGRSWLAGVPAGQAHDGDGGGISGANGSAGITSIAIAIVGARRRDEPWSNGGGSRDRGPFEPGLLMVALASSRAPQATAPADSRRAVDYFARSSARRSKQAGEVRGQRGESWVRHGERRGQAQAGRGLETAVRLQPLALLDQPQPGVGGLGVRRGHGASPP
jgi:hypothetical protein